MTTIASGTIAGLAAHDSHPSYLWLAFLTFQAVLQVVFVCILGFWAARERLLSPSLQKSISQLNVQIFTPCLIFVKLASTITSDKLAALSIIPALFVLTTGVSFLSGTIISRLQRFTRREVNFVTAMAVFANSNSLPVSLTIALAQTLPSLKWLPDDTSDSVASRGILYLLIFQQLGQMLRWSWGYNTLLSKSSDPPSPTSADSLYDYSYSDDHDAEEEAAHMISRNVDITAVSPSESIALSSKPLFPHDYSANLVTTDQAFYNQIIPGESASSSSTFLPSFNRSFKKKFTFWPLNRLSQIPTFRPILNMLLKTNKYMNPPLYAMLLALLVAVITPLQQLLFHSHGFIANTFTAAITQTSQVSVPLVLVVLGSNLYPDTSGAPPSPKFTRLVASSLIARMFIPGMILLPVLALVARYVHVSILDDPVFLVVLFLLTTAPPAIQLSQICQLNEVFEKEMSSILFWGYVVLTLPITMIMVVMSLEVLEWAGRLPSV
ncbi:auxin efflux carrier [Lipomyces japonicus]|uniref:auxin efflux carrier n=1 Tax=Lipomyces japonicus TaxID=56871 RepID=UPI0034CFF60E